MRVGTRCNGGGSSHIPTSQLLVRVVGSRPARHDRVLVSPRGRTSSSYCRQPRLVAPAGGAVNDPTLAIAPQPRPPVRALGPFATGLYSAMRAIAQVRPALAVLKDHRIWASMGTAWLRSKNVVEPSPVRVGPGTARIGGRVGAMRPEHPDDQWCSGTGTTSRSSGLQRSAEARRASPSVDTCRPKPTS